MTYAPLVAQNFNIVHICINDHKAVFEDVIVGLEAALNDLGVPCSRTENLFVEDAVNIVIGAVIFVSKPIIEALRGRPYVYVLYQMEQLAAGLGHLPNYPDYLELMRNASYIWDYSHTNIEHLAKLHITNVIHVPAGYNKSLEVLQHDQIKDIDVLFFGSMSPRREEIIQALRTQGVKTSAANNAYGEERNSMITRAKIVLNLHSSEMNTLEEIRISFLLINKCFVISEHSDHNPYFDGVVFCPYEQIVETCVTYLRSGDETRQVIADKGYLAIQKLDYTSSVKEALKQMSF
jgi:hypothetical protein